MTLPNSNNFITAKNWFNAKDNHLLAKEYQLIEQIMPEFLGNYWFNMGPVNLNQELKDKFVYLGENSNECDVICSEHALPIIPGYIDVFLLQHMLDFCVNPQQLLQQVSICLRDGGQLIVIGLNPGSMLGIKRFFTNNSALRNARFLAPSIVVAMLNKLNFALTHKIFMNNHVFGAFYMIMVRKINVALRAQPTSPNSWSKILLPSAGTIANKEEV